jgi:hypothetical protein
LIERHKQRRVLAAWMQATREMAQRRQIIARLFAKRRQKVCTHALVKWRASHRREQRNDDMVEWYSNAKLRHGLMAKCMQRWSKYAKEKEDERTLARHARAAFRRYKLARHMRAWREHSRQERVLHHLHTFWTMRRYDA